MMASEITKFNKPLLFKHKKNRIRYLEKKFFSKCSFFLILFVTTLFLISMIVVQAFASIDLNKVLADGVLGLCVLYSSYFWSRNEKFGRKWLYCADTHNKIFLDQIHQNGITLKDIEYSRATFAIDLLDCGLWNHKSYYKEFNITFAKAVDYVRDIDSKNSFIPSNATIVDSLMQFSSARDVLSIYQYDFEKNILNNIDLKYSKKSNVIKMNPRKRKKMTAKKKKIVKAI